MLTDNWDITMEGKNVAVGSHTRYQASPHRFLSFCDFLLIPAGLSLSTRCFADYDRINGLSSLQKIRVKMPGSEVLFRYWFLAKITKPKLYARGTATSVGTTEVLAMFCVAGNFKKSRLRESQKTVD